jgi:geranylgeranylglycerol-phosphate geranylgeranyltransferase
MKLNTKFQGIIQLFRPELSFASGICVIVGEMIARKGFPSLWELTFGFLCGFFMAGSALVLNDYFDFEVDKINMPERALPSGMVTKSEVIVLTVLASFLGLGSAYALDEFALAVAVPFWFVGFLYNWKFKQNGLFGNLMVASSVGVTFIIGGIAVGDPWNKLVWFFALIAFLIDLGEEIAGDAMDMAGDRLRGSKSMAILLGKQFALRLSVSIFLLVVLLGFVPIIFGWLENRFLGMVTITGVVVAFFAIKLVKSQTPEEGRRMMRMIYLGPLFGLLAFIVGHFF